MFIRHDDSTPNWHKSSYSDTQDCVEVADNLGDVRVRDTKDRDGHTLRLPRTSWATFTDACRRGEFSL